MLVWHYVFHDLPASPFRGGEYWGKLVFPKEYPMEPPAIYMMTPSGRFETNRRLCYRGLGVTSWNPCCRIESLLIGLVAEFVVTSEAHMAQSKSEGRCFDLRETAKASIAFNRASVEF